MWELLVRGDEEKSQIEFGARQVVIVRDQKAKDNLPRELQSAIVLTVFEAKGLEFDDVFLIGKRDSLIHFVLKLTR